MVDASSGTIRIDGAQQLRRTLKAAGDDLTDLKATHRKVANIAAEASADLAPERSGRLKNTIRSAGTKTAAIIRVGTSRVPYAPPIHWGWFRKHIKPNMFMSRGAQDSEGRWIRVYENDVAMALDKIKGL